MDNETTSKFYGNHASHKSNCITLTRLCWWRLFKGQLFSWSL